MREPDAADPIAIQLAGFARIGQRQDVRVVEAVSDPGLAKELVTPDRGKLNNRHRAAAELALD